MRAIYLLAALVISAQAHADGVMGQFNPAVMSCDSVNNCGGSGAPSLITDGSIPMVRGINTSQQVLEAKKIIDDLNVKQAGSDAVAKLSGNSIRAIIYLTQWVQSPLSPYSATLSKPGSNAPPPIVVKVPRKLIIDALQSQIDDDKAKLSAMGIQQ